MNARDAILEREARTRERQRPAPTVHELDGMTKAELVEFAITRGVDHRGTKADIVERLTHGR